MKKTYSKPLIAIESFALSTNMAADCERIITTHARYECEIKDDSDSGMNLFIQGVCTVPIKNPDQYSDNDGYCYHVPNFGLNLFNS